MSQLVDSSVAGQFDRLPPHSVEAEMCLLASMMLDKDIIGQAVQIVDRDAFFQADHQVIYDVLVKLYEQNKPIDAVIIKNELAKRQLLEEVGGAAYLGQILNTVPSAAHGAHYAGIVREKFMLRQLISASNDILRESYAPQENAELVVDKAEKRIFEIAQKKIGGTVVPLETVLHEVFEMIENRGQRGLETGFFDLDDMLNGLQAGEMIIVAARPSMGKCLAAGAEVLLSDGCIATMEEIYRRGEAELLTLSETGRFGFAHPSAYVDDGIKPVFRVTTRLGRRVECTLTHPFLAMSGWKRLAELRPGDHIAVPRRLNVFGTQDLPDAQAKLLGYMVGGNRVAGASPAVQADFLDALECVGSELASAPAACMVAAGSHASRPEHAAPALRPWLSSLELSSRALKDKSIPAPIFQARRQSVAIFVNRLFATAGQVTMVRPGQVRIEYTTESQKLARQVQHLLVRFGIIAGLRQSLRGWKLEITEARSIRAFIDDISILGQEDALALARELLPASASRHAESDIYWDRILSIEYLGRHQVYDLTIPDTHNFIADDICVHNTAFAMNLVEGVAADRGIPCAVFSLEMSKQQLAQRMLCSRGKIDSHKLRRGMLQSHEYAHLANVVGQLAKAPIWVDDSAGLTPLELRAKARRLKLQHDIKCIMIDYMQLMDNPGPESRQQQISEISRAIKAVARELGVPVIALSQLNRATEGRDGHRPRMSDLRESGSIEQDADVVMLLHREDYYRMSEPDFQPDNIAEVIVAKQRNGPTGTVKLFFDNKSTRFENLAGHAEPF